MTNKFSVRKKRRMKWSRNALAAKARLRLERLDNPPVEAPFHPVKIAPPKHATISIRCGRESLSFRVTRMSGNRFLVRNQFRAASWIGKVVAVAVEGIL